MASIEEEKRFLASLGMTLERDFSAKPLKRRPAGSAGP